MLEPSFSDNLVPFSEYIAQSRELITENRPKSYQGSPMAIEQIIDANSPFVLFPDNHGQLAGHYRHGILLIHGLFDCPFTFREIAKRFQAEGILTQAILLPGHGTNPSDLLSTSYEDWLKTVQYGILSMRDKVDHLFLMGYSTGAALSLYYALQNPIFAGLILLSPAIKIKAPVDIVVAWKYISKQLSKNRTWVYSDDELDYAKYRSFAFNPVAQVTKLTMEIKKLAHKHTLKSPMLMVMSEEDETISSKAALNFFCHYHNHASKMLLYTAHKKHPHDKRIIVRSSIYPDLHIQHFSHVSLQFSPENSHYGQHGDYIFASRPDIPDTLFGAYNRLEINAYDLLFRYGAIKEKRRELTYNPDFDYMTDLMIEFVLNVK